MSQSSSWSHTHAELHINLKQQNSLPPQSRILVAFSGGQDSLCLLRLLLDLQPKWDWAIATIHCDHCWPPDSGDNAAHVAHLAQQWDLTHYAFTAPQILKGEAEGRTWRYRMMADCTQQHNFSHVVTAHTASDRAETLLYHLVRGSGMDGLQALSPKRSLTPDVMLVRPILHLRRADTAQFCREHQLPVWEDTMNQDLYHRRNRMRLKVLPYLREHFNPQVDRAIAQTSELLQADVTYLETQAQVLFSQTVSPGS
ncbi:MAG: tRNA lysidine(34) synthetase TilS, partial [Cyanobacteria bacterium P01_F01_bin.42]